MINAIRSEFLKYFTTRLWWGMAIAAFLIGAGASGFFGFTFTYLLNQPGAGGETLDLEPVQTANTVYTAALIMGAYVLTLTIGVLQVGSEYRHKTITSTLLTTPQRMRSLLAKVIAVAGIAVVNGVILLLGSVVAGAITIKAFGGDPFPAAEIIRSLAMLLLVLVVWGLIGLAAGILIPNQVAALLISIGLAYMVEPMLTFGLQFWSWGAQHLVPYFPTQATSAVVNNINLFGPAAQRLDWWVAALVLLGYAVVLAGLGLWRASREDVS